MASSFALGQWHFLKTTIVAERTYDEQLTIRRFPQSGGGAA